MPAYVSKTTVRSALRLRTKDLDEGIRAAGILPNSRTSQGRPSYWFDQAAMDKLLLALKRKGKIADDLDFDVGNDPKARPKIPSPVEHSAGPAPSRASDEDSSPAPSPGPAPATATSSAPRGTAAAMREYGTPSSVVAFRYYRVRRGRGYVYEGEHADPLSRDEIEDLYGPGTYKIEEWHGAEMVNCWKGFQVGEEQEIEEGEDTEGEIEVDEERRQPGLFPEPAAGGEQAALLDAYRKIQEMTAQLVGDGGGRQSSMIGEVLALMTKQIDAAEKAADRREREAAAAHKRDLERMDKEYESRLEREREFLTTLDSNSKELQRALQDVGHRERDSNTQLLDSIRSTIAEQRQAIADERDSMREERRRMLDDVEDLTRRIKEAGAGQGPIVSLVSQGLQEARTVAQQVMAMKGYGALPAMPGMQMIPAPQGDAAAAAGAGQGGQPQPEAPAGEGGGLFDLMARNRMVQDFLVLASMGIQSGSDPADLAESIVVQSYQDRTGQASVVLNFLSTATPQMVIGKLRPSVEVRDAMLSADGAAYWRAFQDRIRFVLANIRGAAAGQGPGPRPEEPEPEEEDEGEIEPAGEPPKPENAPGGLREGNPPPKVSATRIIS